MPLKFEFDLTLICNNLKDCFVFIINHVNSIMKKVMCQDKQVCKYYKTNVFVLYLRNKLKYDIFIQLI